MPKPERFDLDTNGNVILKPVTEWDIAPVAEMYVMASISYLSDPAELETGGQRIQFVLTSQQARHLAEALKRVAHGVEDPYVSGLPN